MAEKTVSRSQMIRDYIKSVRPSERSPTKVVEALKAKGVNVSAALVSQVKSSLSTKKKNSSKKKSILREMAKTGKSRPYDAKFSKAIRKLRPDWFEKDEFSTLLTAKNLLKSVGGDLSAAKKSLEIISKLLS